MLGSATVPVTGGWETFTNVTGTITSPPAGTTTLYLTFAGGTGALFDLDSFTFTTGARRPAPARSTGLAGKCLDVRGGATADGTQIQLYTCNGTAAQTWTRTGQTLRALGKCLDVSGGGTADGTKIQLWTCNGTGAQNWAAQRRRHAAQPAVRQVPRRVAATTRPTARSSTCGPASRRRQPEVDPALT